MKASKYRLSCEKLQQKKNMRKFKNWEKTSKCTHYKKNEYYMLNNTCSNKNCKSKKTCKQFVKAHVKVPWSNNRFLTMLCKSCNIWTNTKWMKLKRGAFFVKLSNCKCGKIQWRNYTMEDIPLMDLFCKFE